jgi:two-component system, sensor histidine kinase LadS
LTAVHRYVQKAALAAFFLFSLLSASVGVAADLITARAWFEDKSGALSFEEVKQQEFKPYTGVLSRGFGEGAVWLRLTFDPSLPSTEASLLTDRAVLRVRPAYLDSVTLYDPLQGVSQPARTGDWFAASNDEYQSPNLNFVVPKGETSRYIYLRIESTSTRLIEAKAFTLSVVQREDQGLLLLSGVYLGVSALFLFWAIATWLTTRDRIVFSFIFSQACAVGIGFTIFGYVRLWFSDTWGPSVVDGLLTLSVITAVLAASWYYSRLLSEFKPPKAIVWAYRVHLVVVAAALGIFIAGDTRTAVTINWAAVVILPLIGFLGAALARGWDDQETNIRLLPRSVLLVYFGINSLIVAFAGSAGFGMFPQASAFNVYAPLTNGVIAGALAVIVLQYRQNLYASYQASLETRLALAQQKAAQEEASNRERERLLAMLAHQLKNPLAAISMMLESKLPNTPALINQAVLEMNTLIERSVITEKLADTNTLKRFETEFSPGRVIERLISQCREPSAIRFADRANCKLRTDETLFRVLVVNLLDNALKYRAPGADVHLNLDVIDQGIRVTVTNPPGPAGLPDPEHVFDKYYRSPQAYGQSGSGLGLYLVKGLVEQLGGTIDYSGSSERVEFRVWLPLT